MCLQVAPLVIKREERRIKGMEDIKEGDQTEIIKHPLLRLPYHHHIICLSGPKGGIIH